MADLRKTSSCSLAIDVLCGSSGPVYRKQTLLCGL